MAKYELSNIQLKGLMLIINDANIKGSAAPDVVSIMRALSTPVKEVQDEKKKDK